MASSRANKRRYRSSRAVPRQRDLPTHIVSKWTRTKVILIGAATCVLAITAFLPLVILESATAGDRTYMAPMSLHSLMETSKELEKKYKTKGVSFLHKAADSLHIHMPGSITHHEPGIDAGHRESDLAPVEKEEKQLLPPSNKQEKAHPSNEDFFIPGRGRKQQLARGYAGLPMSETPALVGAQPGHIQCDVDDLVYWNDPQGTRDREFKSPFATPEGSYLTFEPDRGGWNNIRMSMEIIFVMAAVTGRTLVLPPKAPFYLLGTGAKNARSFGNFFPVGHPELQKRVKIITMAEFLEREGTNLLGLTEDEVEKLKPVAELCVHKTGDPMNCEELYPKLRDAGLQPKMQSERNCFIFDVDHFNGQPVSEKVKEQATNFCGENRVPKYYNSEYHQPKLIHWDASKKETRLLNHFYAFFFFTDPAIDNFFKRFVRDFLHYTDQIYCAAGKIVHSLNAEGKDWSSLHVRRGDLQYKAVKIPAEEWYNNTKEIWKENEILFIATDERNKTFFDPLRQHYELRFLDDYWDMANLGDLDKNFLGMIDTIVASHGRAFAGTWFSTFSGYINRMRGYLGHTMRNSWYSYMPRKSQMQEWRLPRGNLYAREWPVGWSGIDADYWIVHETEPVFEAIPVSNTAVEPEKVSYIVDPTSVSGLISFFRSPERVAWTKCFHYR